MMDGEWNDPPFLVCRSLARERPLQGGTQAPFAIPEATASVKVIDRVSV
jgi:hypothetical protein